MTWFEAYILWNLNSLVGIFIPIIVVSCAGIIVFTTVFFVNANNISGYEKETETEWYRTSMYWKNLSYKWLKLCIPIAMMSIFLMLVVPTTETLLKIIATKKGVEAVQSDTAHKYLGEIDKAVTNGMKVLNQEIEKKLDKEEKK